MPRHGLKRRRVVQLLGTGATMTIAGCLGGGNNSGGGGSGDSKYVQEAKKIDFASNLKERRGATTDSWPFSARKDVPPRKNGQDWRDYKSFKQQPWEPPESWKDTIAADVDELQIMNHGAANMKYDPATVATYDMFEEATGIKLKPQELGVTKATTKEQQVLNAKDGSLTLMDINGPIMPLMTAKGWLEQTDMLYPDGAFDLYVPTLKYLVQWDNDPNYDGTHAYGFNNILEGALGHLRPDMMKEQGIDPAEFEKEWSWDLLEKAMKAFEGTDAHAFAFYAGDPTYLSYSFRTMLYQTGGRMVQKDGSVKLDTDAAVTVVKKMHEWYSKGWVPGDVVTYGEGDIADLFVAGKLAYVNAFSDLVPTALEHFKPNDQYKPVVPAKANQGPAPTQASLVAPNSVGINTYSSPAQKVAALLYGDARLSYPSQWWEFTYEGNLSYMKSVYPDSSKGGFVTFGDVMGEAINNGVIELFPGMTRTFKRLATHVQNAITGKTSPEQAMKDTQKYVDENINNG